MFEDFIKIIYTDTYKIETSEMVNFLNAIFCQYCGKFKSDKGNQTQNVNNTLTNSLKLIKQIINRYLFVRFQL